RHVSALRGQREEAAALGQERDHPIALRRHVPARIGPRLLQHVRDPDDQRVRRQLRIHALPQLLRTAQEIEVPRVPGVPRVQSFSHSWHPWAPLEPLERLSHTTAYTRHGPPDAPSCFGAPTMIVAPDGGTALRLATSSTPYLPAPRNARWATNFEAD